ncbi:MAG: UTP--glucose-1-phosphate uridylyltransferase [Bacilli bacterium]|jgi:UTP--glucose-1-phosphate uridylyltransferase|nr:UTP--glucose-1-phosphate uridylyltransferase [Bacilli bacterium]
MKRVRKAIIPVAGMGTRFLPATKALAKEMLPIVDKPTIEYIVEEAVKSGIEEILFITSPYKKNIEDHFDRSFELEKRLEKSNKLEQLEMIKNISNLASFYYIRQGEPLGTGHAVRLAKNFIGDEPFAILYGDDIVVSEIPCLKQMMQIYEKNDCNVLCAEELDNYLIPQKGIIEYEDIESGKVKGLVEKPKLEEAPSKHGTLGRYILKPEIFEELEKIGMTNGEYLLTDALLALMKKQDFYACKLEGTYYDVGNQIGYIKANVEFALARKDLSEAMREYLGKLKI